MRISDGSSDVCATDLYYRAVDPARQKAGRGRAMVAAAEAWLAARGVPKVMLMVRPENDRVRAFYDALGYAIEERLVFSRRLDGKRSEEHTSELQSLMRISYAVFCLKKKKKRTTNNIKKRQT